MLKWMCGYIRLEKVGNEPIRQQKVYMVEVSEKVKEDRLWFGNVLKRPPHAAVHKCKKIYWSRGLREVKEDLNLLGKR